MKYTISQFNKDFSDDNACLKYIFNNRYPDYVCPKCGKESFYQVKGRKSFACSCGYQINPTANTIFHKSDTKLKDWFFAIYLFSASKNGVSAKELQRHLGCTYKTAWRIASKIRSLMSQSGDKLSGVVEADETYIGGKKKGITGRGAIGKTPVIGMVQRGGVVRSKSVSDVQTHIVIKELKDNVQFGSRLITDDYPIYKKVGRIGLFHDSINHSKEQYVKGDIHTNTIEGFWSQMKRSMDGTYHAVSAKHLQSYVDEFAYYYNNRFSGGSVFHDLLYRLCNKPYLRGYRIGLSLVKV
jgi:predicted RNA-binding Zn-ribbon protein involved in translation (DUF1610 family)/transposase-like protein